MYSVTDPFGNQTKASFLDRCDIEEAESLLVKDGKIIPAPAEQIKSLSPNVVRLFCLQYGIYSIPTVETIEFVESLILNKEKAIEIGAGNGVYGRTLGIKSTDNYMQHPKNRAKFGNAVSAYEKMGQPLVQYGDDVEEIDGRDAVRKYKAETVLGAWVTHKWNPTKPHLEGNMFGIDFSWILNRTHVKRLIIIGNHNTHKKNPIMQLPHKEYTLDGNICSRSTHPELDRIFVWDC